jgi:hypothetical protein
MPVIRIIGRVIPYAVNVSVANLPKINWKAPDIDLDMTFTINIQSSFVYIECEVNRFEPDHFVHIYNRGLDLARTIVDMLAFTMATSLAAVLDTFIDPNGVPSAIVARDLRLAPLVTAFSQTRQDDFARVISVVLQDWRLMFALNDLIGSISLHHISATNCGRVVESLRNMIAPAGSTRKQSWDVLRNNLNIQESYVRMITDTSIAPRRGDRTHISGETMLEITKRTWIIMNRYLEYQKSGSSPLPVSEFPMLV